MAKKDDSKSNSLYDLYNLTEEEYTVYKKIWSIEEGFSYDDIDEPVDGSFRAGIEKDKDGNIKRTELEPELIEGVLRQHGKMMIAAPSKAGKSCLAEQLAVALANGLKWLGLECKKTSVLYLNFELDAASCQDRFEKIVLNMMQKEVNETKRGDYLDANVEVLNLKGVCSSMLPLATWFCNSDGVGDYPHYDVIIIDPFYSVLDGDENSAQDMKKMCAHLSAISECQEAAVIYVHHHSKGNQGRKNSQDRASGSGVLARDADAIIDLIEILPDKEHPLPDGASAWRASFTLRSFPHKDPIELLFHYPTHEVVEGLETAKTAYGKEVQAKQEKAQAAKNGKKNSKQQRLVEFIRNYTSETGEPPHIETAIDHFINKKGKHEFSSATLYNWVKEDGAGFTIDNGYLFALESDGKTLDTIKPENIVINGVTESEPQETA